MMLTMNGQERMVPAIERALTVMEMLAVSRKGLALSEIARNLALNRSSVYYVLKTLEEHGYVSRPSSRGRYTFTPRLFDLANSSIAGMGIREKAAAVLRQLSEETGLTVHLTILSLNELVILDKFAPRGKTQLPTWVGKRMPVHCTGAGKALLAFRSQKEVEACIARGLIRYNENTIVSGARFRADLELTRHRGYSIDDEEETLGLRCMGAAILEGGQAVAAISVSGSTAQIHEENVEGLGALVRRAAAAISTTLASSVDTPAEK